MPQTYSEECSVILAPSNQILVDVSAQDTQKLLSSASHGMQRRRAEASAILSRLAVLNPTTAKQFHMKEEALSRLKLRMISTRQQQHSPLVDERHPSSFLVVSYCWHYPQWPLAPAAHPIVPGWDISQPMVNSIMDYRQSDEEGVWLDKLCINQQDEEDKQIHIGAMDVIYKSARRLIILLEDVQLDSHEEQAALTYTGIYHDMCVRVREEGLEGEAKFQFVNTYFPRRETLAASYKPNVVASARSFISKILGARWFTRAWCAHEIRVAPHPKVDNPLFLCFGHDGRVLSFEFRAIHYMALYFSESEPETPLSEPLDQTTSMALRHRSQRITSLLPDGSPGVSMMQHLISILSFGCFKIGDLISIALNTSGVPLFYTGDAHVEDDIIWTYSLIVVAAGDVTPLVLGGTRLKFGENNGTTSWAHRPNGGTLEFERPLIDEDSISAMTREYIELDLLLFESLPMNATPNSQAVALRIVQDHNLYDLAEVMSANADIDSAAWKNIERIRVEIRRVKGDCASTTISLELWIALALDCGVEWITQFSETLRKDTQDSWPYGTLGATIDERMSQPAAALLAHFVLESKVGMEQQRGVMRFLTTLMDPRLILLPITPRRLPSLAGASIITPRGSNRSWVAVPVAIAHLPGWQNRAWSVEPLHSAGGGERTEDLLPHLDHATASTNERDKSDYVFPLSTSDYTDKRQDRHGASGWRLRGQQILLAFQPFTDMGMLQDGNEVVLLRRQKIYGAEEYDWGAVTNAITSLKGQTSKTM